MSKNVPKVCFFLHQIHIETGMHRARDPIAPLRNLDFTALLCASRTIFSRSFCVKKHTFEAFLQIKI